MMSVLGDGNTLCTCSLRRVVVFHAIIKSLVDSHTYRNAGGLGTETLSLRGVLCAWMRVWADRGRAEPRSEGIVCVYVYVIFCVCLCVSVCVPYYCCSVKL